ANATAIQYGEGIIFRPRIRDGFIIAGGQHFSTIDRPAWHAQNYFNGREEPEGSHLGSHLQQITFDPGLERRPIELNLDTGIPNGVRCWPMTGHPVTECSTAALR